MTTIKCPVCGKAVEKVRPANFANDPKKYFAFVVHNQTVARGHSVTFVEDRGCFLTRDQFHEMMREDAIEPETEPS